ncbi:site-specific integrase [Plebeiibacterium sediminum]|uniref:Site-specific integrase n=1 Tax=Plebeiibacterium sediminum TaxID=2992112 RepID=A0AAE3M7Y6_9BACT|nr:site-specific integrase [Plebeiobacterium sediminum]MCW3788215.1 site-specific integrase [Plebeiobacterium sediminum]
MTTNQTFAITFLARTDRKEKEICSIYARINVNGKRSEFSVVRSIPLEAWNPTKERIDSKYKDFRKSNAYIEQVRAKITNIHRELVLKEESISAIIIKNIFFGRSDNGKTLIELFEYHNISQVNVLSPGTLKNYYTTHKYISKYLREIKKIDDIILAKINYQFITGFESYLRNYVPSDHHRPLSNNGVMKHLERLRKVTTMAIKLEWLEKDPFERFKFSFNKVDRGYLTDKELNTIKTKSFNIPRLQFVKDLFIFSCYTGLSYIDVINLTNENIIMGIDGEYWIQTIRQKTEMVVNIPLLPVALNILNNYKDHPKSIHGDQLFPSLSNQKLNSYLKEVGDICGIQKSLTFHMARHTFATTVTLSNGVPIETVSKVLGHSNLSTTMIYARVLKTKISEDMHKLKDKLNNQKDKINRCS